MAEEITSGFTPEPLPNQEAASETVVEKASAPTASAEKEMPAAPASVQPIKKIAASVAAPTPADPISKEVESVLSENIGAIYKQLPQEKKALFKQRGEEATSQIVHMIRSGLLQIKKILGIIHDWLKLIPGVNAFFLEQEAKIKTDKIQELFNREHAPVV